MPRRPNFPPSTVPHRQLTRARQLRHLEDHEVFGLDLSRKSPRSRGLVNGRLVAGPQPLPLPDLAALLAGDRSRKSVGDGFRLPSPEEVKSGDSSYGSSPISSHRSSKPRMNGSEKWLSGADKAEEEFDIQGPVRSAPVTAYSSPVLSPRRSDAGDLVSSYRMAYQASGSREALSNGTDPSQALSNPESPVRTINKSQVTYIARPKLFVDTSNMNFNSNGPLGSYPLPLPPGASAQSPSHPISQSSTPPSFLSYTSMQSSPNRQTSAQSSPHQQLSGQSSPSPQITPRPHFKKKQWSKGKMIGRGTFGTVYLATNRKTGALCAMKEVELCPDDSKSIESMKQLEQEIKVLSNLKHPNIVQYYGSEMVGNRFYIYLEYVYPGSIDRYIHDHCGAMTESVVRNFTRHILSGLAYLHGTWTIHRDIKGANLLVDASGAVKLADFGMAKHLTGQAANLSLKGSPHWMAPELIQAVMRKGNSSDIALAVDIWSLGCTVIEMFSGKPPWSGYEGAAAMFKVLRECPPIPETLSDEGKDFLRCCFQRDPAQRPSASKLLEHQFVRNSHHLDASFCLALSNGSFTTGRTHGAKELPMHRLDQMSASPTTKTIKQKLTLNKESSQQAYPETSDAQLTACLSPRSTLEDLPGLSPPHTTHSNPWRRI